MNRLLLVAVLSTLSACQSLHLQGRQGEDSPNFQIPAGSKLVLHQDLAIPAPVGATYLQHGRAGAFHEINEFVPYCLLEQRPSEGTTKTVRAGEFVIATVRQEFRFAGAGARQLVAAGQSFQPTHVVATVLELRSDSAPHSLYLSCAHWGMPQSMSHLTLRDIRDALGDVASLELER
ncbi:MAG: hypothetical protein ACE5LB_10695 [Acidiferrobacterales bacterium]